MPKFYFHLTNGTGLTKDDEGVDLPSGGSIHEHAVTNIRSIVAEEARAGVIDLTGHIEVVDTDDKRLALVAFPEAFDLKLAGETSPFGSGVDT